MRHALRPQRHAVAMAVFAATLCGFAPASHASDAYTSAPHGKAEVAAEPKPADTEKADPQKPAARAASRKDPLDVIRERLAEKLGAAKPTEAEPNVLRVVSKVSMADTGHAPRAPARPSATALAAKHRESPAVDVHAGAAHWDYAGSGGPGAWGQMKPEFATCGSGTRQSPIDIRDGIKVNLDPVQFDYKPSSFRVIDNGHTVQVNVGPGNSIEVMGRRYDLLQFHFHRPSEERINGKQFDMVAHLVHKDLDGRLAVVAVLLERGSAHPLVQSVWNNLPLEKGEDVAARTTLDMNTLLPTERSYFTYMGSLTTPPCSEGVLWMVMKTPMPIAPDQIGVFSRLYPMNARPLQSVAGRLIKESN